MLFNSPAELSSDWAFFVLTGIAGSCFPSPLVPNPSWMLEASEENVKAASDDVAAPDDVIASA